MTPPEAARAYEAVAAEYDSQVIGDQWMRSELWRHYARLFKPGDRVLDVGCGTGSDALFLAGRGIRVVGIDLSPGMVARLWVGAAERGLADRVDARVMDFADLSSFSSGSFDGIVSAFAGLSSVPDLSPFAAGAARLLRPGGRLVVHLLNRFSLWEWLGLVKRGRWAEARRLGRQRERVFTIGGEPVRHYLFSPAETYCRFFAPHLSPAGAYGLGILRPPHTVRRVPAPVAEALGELERCVARRRPFLNWGRFFVLDMVSE